MADKKTDDCSQPNLMPIHVALARMQAAITPISDTEEVALLDALDRTLAAPIRSPIPVPSSTNSAMDGYALHADFSAANLHFRVIGQSLAGHPYARTLDVGDCVRITTGATLPAGANCVVMQERVSRIDDSIVLNQLPVHHDNIRWAGEDIQQGQSVFAQGHRISAIDIGLLASLGCATVSVFRRLRVAVLSTGDELTPIDQPLHDGHIYDSNRYALRALLSRLNLEIIDKGLIPDDPEQIRAAFLSAAQEADAIISTGGVSVGDADYTKQVLDDAGKIDFWKVAMKPGKPFAFGRFDTEQKPVYFFGLPGNPVSAVVTYHQLVLPNLRYLAGDIFTSPTPLVATASHALKKQVGRADFQRGILSAEDNTNTVASTGSQSSGVLTSMAAANCYIVLPQNSGDVASGEAVKVIPFDHFIR